MLLLKQAKGRSSNALERDDDPSALTAPLPSRGCLLVLVLSPFFPPLLAETAFLAFFLAFLLGFLSGVGLDLPTLSTPHVMLDPKIPSAPLK